MNIFILIIVLITWIICAVFMYKMNKNITALGNMSAQLSGSVYKLIDTQNKLNADLHKTLKDEVYRLAITGLKVR